ncbi:hypothetical protein CGZ69_00475 [Streptomyces peucetius subsp. caesius ATCC 27952]|nr:hypothetical protein CGZ69_00475 [Streptomyces peucetius subsp. caesius ATCC 27952]
MPALPAAVAAPVVTPAATAAVSAVSDDQKALAEAAETGERVEVAGERTERETVFANPDGVTFTLEKSITPVRVAAPEGGWVAPDATLVRRSDGSVGPKAAAVDLAFSAGGDGKDLVRIADDGQAVALGWPGELPPPRLEGERAVYPNVLPDVDLIMTATVEGFRQVLEVKTPEAAANPALRTLDFALGTDNLRMERGAGGGVDALDGNGQVVFRSPAARMWDSAGDAAQPADGVNTQVAGVRPLGESAAESDPMPAGPVEEGDPLAGPGAGDESAVLDLEVSKDTVTVTPDAEMLSGTAADAFPLYIDPSVELNESERTVLSSDGDVFYNFSGGDTGMSVGKCGTGVVNGVAYYCGSGYVNRMYFEFAPGNLKGKHVLDATFRVTETWSFACEARWVDLERTNNISSASKWPGPAKLDQMGDRNVSAGRNTLCDPSQPRAPIEFNDYPAEPDENLTPTVRAFADGKFARLTLMLMAKDESDTVAWKRFDDDAVLSVDYVGKPALPSNIGLVTGTNTQTCRTTEATALTVTDPTPAITATPQTAAGGEAGAQLRAVMDTEKKSGTSWTNLADIERPTSGYVGDNVRVTVSTPTLEENALYRYRAWTRSYYGGGYLSGPSNASTTGWCYFKVDSTAPKAPTITFNGPYTQCATTCDPRGGVGIEGKFTLGPAAGDVNTAYRYKLSTNNTWSGWISGATVQISVTPTTSGTILLSAEAKDTVGDGAETTVQFNVKEGNGPLGSWDFDTTDATTGAVIDTSTTNSALRDDATLYGGATLTDRGRRGQLTGTDTDRGLSLNGTTAYAATSGPVIDTRASYAVAAWVHMDQPTGNHTALGQDGVNRSPFLLGYEHSLKKWTFRAVDSDAPADGTWSYQRVASQNNAVSGVWTHLVGTYDAAAKTLSLYVNGQLQGTTAYTTAWNATGPLQIGRVKWSGSYVTYFPGSIDEVAIWQQAATTAGDQFVKHAELKDANGKPHTELVASYRPAGAQGTSLADTSGYGRPLTLAAGASLNGEELVLDGTSGAGTAAGPLVDDSGSFTVTTEALVDSAKMLTKTDGYKAQILGQRTATGSSWSLWFEKTKTRDEVVRDEYGDPVFDENGEFQYRKVPVGRWHFGRLTADGSGVSVSSIEDPLADDEVRLTGVFNAQAGTISLYLTAEQQNHALAYTAAVGSGEFAVGKGYLNSVWGNYLPGRISDIRLWSGALADGQHVADVLGTNSTT